MTIKIVKELLEEFDFHDRKGNEDQKERLADELDKYWRHLTPEEVKDASDFSIELHEMWTPLEKYKEALETLASIDEAMNSPYAAAHPGVYQDQLDYWRKKRDEALSKIQSDQLSSSSLS